MSRSARVSFNWGDATYTFKLGIAQLEELQEKTDCGPLFILNRINGSDWKIHDLRETIRLGLIGGGVEPTKATVLLRRYFDDRPLTENIDPARAILMAALIGAPDGESPGKSKATKAKKPEPISKEGSSPLPPSMETVQQ